MKHFLRILSLSLIPALLIFIGKDDFFFRFLVSHEIMDDDLLKTCMNYSFFGGILISNLIIPLELAKGKKRLILLESNISLLLGNTKDYFSEALKSELQLGNIDFNIRVFFQVYGFIKFFQMLFCRKRYFKVRNIKGLAEDELTDELCFQVTPIPQGLVGLTYSTRNILYDSELKKADLKQDYNLTDYQISHTSNAEFVATAPVFNASNRIVAIISIDSIDRIIISGDAKDKLREIIIKYCLLLDKFLPLIRSKKNET